jgi:hypothetical protein
MLLVSLLATGVWLIRWHSGFGGRAKSFAWTNLAINRRE